MIRRKEVIMTKLKVAKGLTLFAALATGVSLVLSGQINEGVGVVLASFSSMSVFGKDGN